MTVARQIHYITDILEEPEQVLVLEIMKRFLPDYVATEEDLEDIARAKKEFVAGKTVSFNDVDWD
ncbi:MAG: hypothetical protein FWG38_04725 [Defluviitaleaceae bacterium]|nr:hypothetical protein [Defluviitaleaceae bacterium]